MSKLFTVWSDIVEVKKDYFGLDVCCKPRVIAMSFNLRQESKTQEKYISHWSWLHCLDHRRGQI